MSHNSGFKPRWPSVPSDHLKKIMRYYKTMALFPAIASTLKPDGLMFANLSRSTWKVRQLKARQLKRSFTSKLQPSSDSETVRMQTEAQEEVEKLEEFYNTVSYRTPKIWKDKMDARSYVEEKIDTVLFDCDGVLYRSSVPTPGAQECIQGLMDKGKNVLFVTNNAGVNRRELRTKLSALLGIGTLTNEQMVSSSYSCAEYLKAYLPPGGRVHVIGSRGLCEELAGAGYVVSGGPSSEPSSMTREELAEYPFPEHPIDAVVVGHDIEFNFRKLCVANNLLLRNPESLFVATNEDSFDLVGSDSRQIPGNGCAVKALEHCSGKSSINVGKPSSILAKLIADKHGLDHSRSLFVGDRLDTDIRFGTENCMKSALVMTGVTTAETMLKVGPGSEEEPLPDFVAPYVGVLV